MKGHRGIRLVGVAAAMLAITATACARPAPAPGPPATSVASSSTCGGPTSPPAGVIATVFNRTNSDRAANGLGALRWNAQLYCLANDWSQRMASTGVFAHQDLASVIRASTYSSFRTLGENIVRGPGSMTGDQIQAAWMNSPSHRANILSSGYSSVGIATAVAADGSLYATVDFGG